MKKIIIINALVLSLFATHVSALGSVAETQIEKKLSTKTLIYKENSSFNGHINKRLQLGETLPAHLTNKATPTMQKTLRLPHSYNAVSIKRMKLSENYL